jgi:hypothetical protein
MLNLSCLAHQHITLLPATAGVFTRGNVEAVKKKRKKKK